MNCGYFAVGLCHSCTWLEVPYSDQLAQKDARVRELLEPGLGAESGHRSEGASHRVQGGDLGRVEWLPPVPSAVAGFRTKVKLVVSGSCDEPILGILDASQSGIDLRECPIVAPAITQALPSLAEFIGLAGLTPYRVSERRGELKNLIITVSPAGELMVRFVLRSTEALRRIRKHLGWLRERLPAVRVVTVNLLPAHAAVLEGEEEIVLSDEGTLPLRLPGSEVALQLGPHSFVQTNTGVSAALYAEAREWVAGLDPHAVWDLYCGIGGFALYLAGRVHDPTVSTSGASVATRQANDAPAHGVSATGVPATSVPATGVPATSVPATSVLAAGVSAPGVPTATVQAAAVQVTGVELSPEAVAGARLAASEAGIEASFVAHDATGWAREQLATPGVTVPDVVVVNPPRRGIGVELARLLDGSGIRHVLYSSCNPDSLARDLANMPSYELQKVRLFDMFPHTAHAEVLVLLSRPQTR